MVSNTRNEGAFTGLDYILLAASATGIVLGARAGFLAGESVNNYFEYLRQASNKLKTAVDIGAVSMGAIAGSALFTICGLEMAPKHYESNK